MGAQLCIDAINAKGGIGGEKFELITLDDKVDTKLLLGAVSPWMRTLLASGPR